MPISPGENADLLRAIGRLLDSEGARELQLVNNEAFITVSWRSKSGGSDQRHFQDHNLEGLRRAARDSRGDSPRGSSTAIADLLRTLGQDLDQEQAEFAHISQEPDGFVVTGSISGRYLRRKYPTANLRAANERRRALRRVGPPPVGQARGAPSAGAPERARPSPATDEGPLSRRLKR